MFNDNCSRPTNEETNIEADGNTFEFSYMDPTEKAVGFFQCKKKNVTVRLIPCLVVPFTDFNNASLDNLNLFIYGDC